VKPCKYWRARFGNSEEELVLTADDLVAGDKLAAHENGILYRKAREGDDVLAVAVAEHSP